MITENIEEFLYDSTIIHTDTKDVPSMASWEVEAAPRIKKSGTATGNDLININTVIAGEGTISKTLANLYTLMLIRKKNTHSVEER